MRWLFWNVDWSKLDVVEHRDLILSRVLERGKLVDVRWAVNQYGRRAIRAFFERGPHPEVSVKTVRFWNAALRAEEPWPEQSAFRQSSSAPWVG